MHTNLCRTLHKVAKSKLPEPPRQNNNISKNINNNANNINNNSSNSNYHRITAWNAHSIIDKRIHDYIHDNNPLIFAICETWHIDNTNTNKNNIYLHVPNYNTISHPFTKNSGGHLIYIHQQIQYKELHKYNIIPIDNNDDSNNNSTQITTIEFTLPNSKPYIFVFVYIKPTTTSVRKVTKLLTQVHNKYNNTHNIIIAGDFNLHNQYVKGYVLVILVLLIKY
jgi:hypothetical protein